MKLQNVRVKVIEEADAATLETSVNTFLKTESQREFQSIQYQVSVSETAAAQQAVHAAMIVYTE